MTRDYNEYTNMQVTAHKNASIEVSYRQAMTRTHLLIRKHTIVIHKHNVNIHIQLVLAAGNNVGFLRN